MDHSKREEIDLLARRVAEEMGKAFSAITGQHGAALPPLPVMAGGLATEGWHEVTTLLDLGRGVRTFVAGEHGSRQVAAAGVELGKARAELHALKASLLELAGEIETRSWGGPGAVQIVDEIRKRVGR